MKYNDFLDKRLIDIDECIAYLNAALKEIENGDDISIGIFLLSLKDVISVRIGMRPICTKTKFSRAALYRTLKKDGNPQLLTIVLLLDAMDLELQVTKKQKEEEHTHDN